MLISYSGSSICLAVAIVCRVDDHCARPREARLKTDDDAGLNPQKFQPHRIRVLRKPRQIKEAQKRSALIRVHPRPAVQGSVTGSRRSGLAAAQPAGSPCPVLGAHRGRGVPVVSDRDDAGAVNRPVGLMPTMPLVATVMTITGPACLPAHRSVATGTGLALSRMGCGPAHRVARLASIARTR